MVDSSTGPKVIKLAQANGILANKKKAGDDGVPDQFPSVTSRGEQRTAMS